MGGKAALTGKAGWRQPVSLEETQNSHAWHTGPALPASCLPPWPRCCPALTCYCCFHHPALLQDPHTPKIDAPSFQASSDLKLQAWEWGASLGRGHITEEVTYTILMVLTIVIVITCLMRVLDKHLQLSYLTSQSPSVVTSHCPNFMVGNARGHREDKVHMSILQCFLMIQLSKPH